MIKNLTVVAVAAAVLMLAGPTYAHHGTSLNYNWEQAFVAPAVVTEFRFRQPHPQIYFDVTDEDGNVENWACEVGPNIPWMIREGWTRQRSEAAVAPGTVVTVTLTPAWSGEPVGIVNKIVNEQGESLLVEFGMTRPTFKIVKVVE
jgi:hypothetical protein